MVGLYDLIGSGQQRRQALDEFVGGLEQFIPPNLRPAANLAAQMNPIQGMSDSMQQFGVATDSGRSMDERRRAAMGSLTEGLLAVAPAALAAKGYLTPAQGVMESMLGGSPATQQIGDDVARYVASEVGSVPIGIPSDPITQRGDEILGLLSTNPASVTDEMLDMGDAVSNARLNEYLFNNYDLPMDEASRMARAGEMGFGDDVWYHGTPDNRGLNAEGFATTYEQLYPERERVGPYFLTDNPRVAATYADDTRAFDYQNADPETLRLYSRAHSPLVVDAKGDTFRGIEADYLEKAMQDKYGGGPMMDNFLRELQKVRRGEDEGSLSTDAVASLAKRFGLNDVVDVKRVRDTYTGEGPTSTVRMFSDPSSVRRTSARFDPRLSHLRNLSAGLGGLGLLGYIAPDEQQGGI